MPGLQLGHDIKLEETDKDTASVSFKILDASSVDRFLNNEALMSFLKDPWTGDESAGCRLTIVKEGDRLTIGRQMNPRTLRDAACADLVASLQTYIVHPEETRIGEWPDITGGLRVFHDVDFKTLTRGVAFDVRGDSVYRADHK